MKVHPDRPILGYSTGCEQDDLLFWRMATLGLDLDIIERGDSKVFNVLKQRCAKCNFQPACEIDLRRDPNNPVWEAYCPNSTVLNELPVVWWLPH